MIGRLLIILVLLLSTAPLVFAEECHFQYWQLIPTNTCKVYHLPDFTFSEAPQPLEKPEHVRRFCTDYEVVSKFGKQLTGYCYTGEGDKVGPTFKLGDEKWNFQNQDKENVFFADLNFSGCYKGKKSSGVVFGVYGWQNSPKEIERSWPVEERLAKCES